MNLAYEDIFDIRGDRYHRAMLSQPGARTAEFERLFDVSPVTPGQRVLDVPAGGGYLGAHLGPGFEVTPFELAAGFGGGVLVVDADRDWPVARFDHVVCLAALHHIGDQAAFLRRLCSHTLPGGVVHVADVALHSPLTTFLDEFVGRYNVTGHDGRYLPADPAFFQQFGTVRRLQEADCPWRFAGHGQMLEFCGALFGLEACPPQELAAALERIGVHRHDDGSVSLAWRLLYADIVVG